MSNTSRQLAEHLATALRYPRLFRNYEQIFLLSHMRANTSVLGHILGANPEIEGYFEMHIGYFSWKSRLRQKLLYFAEHHPKPAGRYIFDKILHNDHAIGPAFLRSGKIIFSLRPPEMTVPSIVNLYRDVNPGHEYCEPDRAFEYYCGRLPELSRLAAFTPEYCYLDAQALRDNSAAVLSALSNWLALDVPLKEKYRIQPKTGEGRAGDNSENLKHGELVKTRADYSHIELDPEKLQEAVLLYNSTRESLRLGASLVIGED